MGQEEESIPYLAGELMKDIDIKDDVKNMLGPEFQASHTWGDVHDRMQHVSTLLKPELLDDVKQKLREEVKKKRDEEKVAQAVQHSHITKSNNSATGFNDQTQAAPEKAGLNSKEEKVASAAEQTEMTHKNDKGKDGIKENADKIAVLTAMQAPVRDYRDAQGNDHGYAMRMQLLNPPADSWANI